MSLSNVQSFTNQNLSGTQAAQAVSHHKAKQDIDDGGFNNMIIKHFK